MQFVIPRIVQLTCLPIFLLFTAPVFSQKKDPKIISMKLSDGAVGGRLPVSDIIVHDVRFDTSSIGLEESAAELRFIRLLKGLDGSITEFFNSRTALDKNSTFSLHLFVKKMVLSNHIYPNSAESSKKFDNAEMPGIVFTTELYLQDKNVNAYTPIFRLDTMITGKKNVNFGGGQAYVETALSICLEKMIQTDWEKIRNTGRRLNANQVTEYYTNRMAVPILQTAEPVKGLYLSYDDFRNNKPHVIDFVVEEGSKGDFLYIKNDKGELILQHEIWGYCDGKNMFISSASNYFKLIRTSNSFFIYGAKDFTARRSLRLNFSLMDAMSPNSNLAKSRTRKKYHLDQTFLVLDMETGELF